MAGESELGWRSAGCIGCVGRKEGKHGVRNRAGFTDGRWLVVSKVDQDLARMKHDDRGIHMEQE